jgi:hypothetical protein
MDRRQLLALSGFLTGLSGCMEAVEQTTNEEDSTQGQSSDSTSGTDGEGEISLSDLSIESSSIDLGETVTISAVAENTGEASTTESITVLVDGTEIDSERISLSAGKSTTIEFEYTPETNGTLVVSVGDLSESLEVLATEVGGIIESDTSWTTDEGSYLITETVQVARGATLTIEPDVIVHAVTEFDDDALFLLNGEIIAEGSSDADILIDGHGTDATFFDAEGSSPDAFLSVEHCLIRDGGSFWWQGNGGFNLRNSELRNVDSSYIWYPYQDTSGEGAIPHSEIHIEYNTFINAGAFSIGHDDRYTEETIRVFIRNNVFTGWTEATYGGLINNWASYGSSETIVEYNSFLDMTDEVILKLPAGYDDAAMIGTNNFWDTTDESTVQEMIYDSNDDIESAGEISYTPILEDPDSETPQFDE